MKDVGDWHEKIQGFERTPKPDLTEWRPKPPAAPAPRIIKYEYADSDLLIFFAVSMVFACGFIAGVIIG
jgi:hypothetical protein